MRSLAIVPEWSLESIWLDRLEKHLSDDSTASFMLASLRRTVPGGPRTLVHGDFSIQNFIRNSVGIMLVDWEEIGSAPSGFDAGWMLALARLGYGQLRSYRDMFEAVVDAGFPKSNVSWFEALGLLRLLFRARTLPIDDDHRQLVLAAVQQAVDECAAGMGWRNKRNGDAALNR
jgi:aminoglycoside phosphotransferase (APT) family kinase protein